MCLSILAEDEGWRPSITVKQILTGIQDLLDSPNPLSPAQSEAFVQFTQDKGEYEKCARRCVPAPLVAAVAASRRWAAAVRAGLLGGAKAAAGLLDSRSRPCRAQEGEAAGAATSESGIVSRKSAAAVCCLAAYGK